MINDHRKEINSGTFDIYDHTPDTNTRKGMIYIDANDHTPDTNTHTSNIDEYTPITKTHELNIYTDGL